MQVNG